MAGILTWFGSSELSHNSIGSVDIDMLDGWQGLQLAGMEQVGREQGEQGDMELAGLGQTGVQQLKDFLGNTFHKLLLFQPFQKMKPSQKVYCFEIQDLCSLFPVFSPWHVVC